MLPVESNARLYALSPSPPLNVVEYTTAVPPVVLIFATITALEFGFGGLGSGIVFVTAKSEAYVWPAMPTVLSGATCTLQPTVSPVVPPKQSEKSEVGVATVVSISVSIAVETPFVPQAVPEAGAGA